MPVYTTYDGHEWVRYPEAKKESHRNYFQHHFHWKKPPTYLHRYIWEKYNGVIPRGMHIHHIDGDFQNNEISNLEMLTPAQHIAMHPWTKDRKIANKQHLDSIRDLTKVWHCSAEGIAWHSKNGKAAWDNRQKTKKQCEHCGKDYLTYYPNKARSCSRNCIAALWRKKQKILRGGSVISFVHAVKMATGGSGSLFVGSV